MLIYQSDKKLITSSLEQIRSESRSDRRSIQEYVTERATQMNKKVPKSEAKEKNMVTIEKEIHLFPSRTQKLSLSSLMILGVQTPGKVSRSQFQWPLGQAVKTPPFHGGNRGSNPLGVTKRK